MAVYDIDDNVIAEMQGGQTLNYDASVRSINHRGYNTVAPENTLPAFKLSKKMGFNFVECDVAFTSDGVAMLLHDSTINRTSNGTGTLSQMTYAQVRQYDFGSWKSAEYAGTVIPTFDEFITLCKNIGLHPYIELKIDESYTEAQIQGVVDSVKKHGMQGKVTYISFSSTYLGYVKNYDPTARLGLLVTTAYASHTTACSALKTTTNEVIYGPQYETLTTEICEAFAAAGIPIEVWVINTEEEALTLLPYVSEVTTDSLLIGKVLYDANID